MKELDLARDVLDKQVVDEEETQMGRVDGLVLELRDSGPPRVEAIELGFVVLARRVHPWVERWAERLHRRLGVRKSARQRVPWAKVEDVTPHHIQLAVKLKETPAFDWERWLRNHVVAKIPGSRE